MGKVAEEKITQIREGHLQEEEKGEKSVQERGKKERELEYERETAQTLGSREGGERKNAEM